MAVSPDREYLQETIRPSVRVTREGDTTAVVMSGRPFVGLGPDLDAALTDLVLALREYADDYDELKSAPNHTDAEPSVRLIRLSTDAQLLEWFEQEQ